MSDEKETIVMEEEDTSSIKDIKRANEEASTSKSSLKQNRTENRDALQLTREENVSNDMEAMVTNENSAENKSEVIEELTVSKCSSKKNVDQTGVTSEAACKPIENGDLTLTNGTPSPEEGKLSSDDVDEENVSEMFTDELIDELKEDLIEKIDDGKPKNLDSEKNEAVQLFQQGKRNLLVNDFESAVDTLNKACLKFVSIYGDCAPECVDVQMSYGHALLELWKHEEANKKEDDFQKSNAHDIIDENAETDIPEVDEMINEINDAETVTNGNEKNEADESIMEANDDETVSDEKESEVDEGATGTNEDEVIGDECDEDLDSFVEDNLQLAWEVFETVKNTCTKHNDNVNLALVYMKLGEISLLSGSYDVAIKDLKRNLRILENLPIVGARQLANNHFQLYIAYSAKCSFPQAETEIRIAKRILEDRLNILENKLRNNDTETCSSDVSSINSEIKELEELTKEITVKMEELDLDKDKILSRISTALKNRVTGTGVIDLDTVSQSSAVEKADSSSTGFSPLKSNNVPVHNISHLVRKKPKILAEKEMKSEEAKQINEEEEKSEVKQTPESTEGDQCSKRKADEDAGCKAKKICVREELK